MNHRLSDSLQLHLKTVIVEVVEMSSCALISVTPADQSRSQYQCPLNPNPVNASMFAAGFALICEKGQALIRLS